MVKFELRRVGEAQQLVIKDDSDNKTMLPIFRPLTGKHALSPPALKDILTVTSSSWSSIEDGLQLLRSPMHKVQPADDRSFSTLGRRIISGEVKWGKTLKVNGKFRQTPKYWEWVEEILDREGAPLRAAQIYDAVHASLFTYSQNPTIMRAFYEAWCSETNSLHATVGEVSITLWDLHVIGGLPLLGAIYDEAIPYPDELVNKNVSDDSLMPPSCRFLLAAFHQLCVAEKKKSVSASVWVRFWFKGGLKYKRPRAQPFTKFIRSSKTGNPSGVVDSVYDWLPETKRVFSELGVPDALFDEVYLAAFLSCWLSTFVLPEKSTPSIRANVFKPASLMASGHVLCLGFPVLAAIYKGLNTIAHSSTPGSPTACFPQHYLTSWMANYFGTHHRQKQLIGDSKMSEYSGEGGAKSFSEAEARELIHSGNSINWNAVSFVKSQTQIVSGAKRPSNDDQRNRFAAIRPCMLSFRYKNAFNLEPYNPHRFSRQFGYSQRTPCESGRENIRSSTLEEGMKHWLLSQHEYPKTSAYIPSLPKNSEANITPNFVKWWDKVHGQLFVEGRQLLINSVEGNTCDPTNSLAQDPLSSVKNTIEVGTSSKRPPAANNERPGKRIADCYKALIGEGSDHFHSLPSKKIKFSVADGLKKDASHILDDVPIPDPLPPLKDINQLLFGENSESDIDEGKERVSLGSDELCNIIDSSGHSENDNGKTLEDDVSSSFNLAKTGDKRVDSPSHSNRSTRSTNSASKYDDDILMSSQKFVRELWGTLVQNLADYRTGDLCLLEERSNKIMRLMEATSSTDISFLKKMVSDFFVKVRECNHQGFLYVEPTIPDIVFKEKKDRLALVIAEEGHCKTRVASFHSKLVGIETEMTCLRAEEVETRALLVKEEEKIAEAQCTISALNSQVSELMDQRSKNSEAANQKKKLSEEMDTRFKELKTLKLFP